MEEILDPDTIREHKKELSKNYTLPLSESGRESFSSYLLVAGQADHLSLLLLVERNLVYQLLTRPHTVNFMAINNVFDPLNAPEAYKTGAFSIGAESQKTTYTSGSSQHQGIGTHNSTVYPSLINASNCPVLNIVTTVVQLEQTCVNPNLKLTDRILDSLQGTKKRPTRKSSTKGTRIANSSKLNLRFRNKFRNGR